VRDAKPGDIYVDSDGRLYRVTGIFQTPTVEMTQIEGEKRLFGGVGGLMWQGFKRIYRGDEE
jgi:hypothetical protein